MIQKKCHFNIFVNTGLGSGDVFSVLATDEVADFSFISNNQAYSLYYYDESGNQHSAISGYALNVFQKHYNDPSIHQEEIFYSIYAIFHHKGYLDKYQNSLKKEAPRVGLSKDFKELSRLGRELAELHLNYESGEMHDKIEYKEGVLADTRNKGIL